MKSCLKLCLILSVVCPVLSRGEESLEIGSRRELFVDRYLIAEMRGAELKLNPLSPAAPSSQPALAGHYATVLRDGDTFRQYCRGDKIAGLHWRTDGWETYHAAELTLLAESLDGIVWRKPDLGRYEIERYPHGNVVLADKFLVNHNFTPMIDTKPGVDTRQRYKAIGGGSYRQHGATLRLKYGDGGLYAFCSPDGVHWDRLRDEPIIPENWGSFDSQNVAFYSPAEAQYVCYFRTFEKGFRTVSRSTSRDFMTWTEPMMMRGRMEKEHLYTSGVHPYFRAPHIYIAPATWYLPGENPNTRVVLLTSRAGSDAFDRTFGREEFLPNAAAGNRTNYIAWTNGVRTGLRELSFYSLGTRFTLRLDGFGSLHADGSDGQAITRPFTFSGDRLTLNYSARVGGSVRVEICDLDDEPIEGFSLEQCVPLVGDEIDGRVRWKSGAELGDLAGRAVSLRFVVRLADVFAMQFSDENED
ncbi:MAG: hypothetical protein KDA42_09915 [Planctomycetales bacterium]|nr:hypothetical protein [Planctomycetales bacterium]